MSLFTFPLHSYLQGLNPTLLRLAKRIYLGQTELFNLGIATNVGEGKLQPVLIHFNSNLCCIVSVAKGVRKDLRKEIIHFKKGLEKYYWVVYLKKKKLSFED